MFYTSAFLRKKQGKNGSYWVGVLSYKDSEGKWRQKPKSLAQYHLKRDAQKALNEWWEEEEALVTLERKGTTIQQAIEECIQNQRTLNQISKRTHITNLRLARKAIFPYVGELEFAKATHADIQEFVNMLSERYKPESVRTIFTIVSKTYKWGVRNNRVLKDITKETILPKDGMKRINYLDKDGRKKFLAAMTDKSKIFYYPSLIAFYTGMRAGEVCGLRWRDVNFATNSIFVEYNAKEYRDLETNEMITEVSDTKTYKKRRIPLLPQLKKILQEKMKEDNPNPNDLVCGTERTASVCSCFRNWANTHKIIGTLGKPVTMHGLRHTFATLGVQSGMDIKSLSSILGHSSTAMTLDIYASSDEHAKMNAMQMLGNFMRDEEKKDL